MSTHTAIGSTGLNNVSTLQLPTPTPDADEVLIEMNYSSLIAFDTYQVDRGFYVGEYPHVLGFSGAGKIKSVGGQVNDLKEGDRVAAFTFPQAKNKSLQDYTVIPRFNVAKVPDSVPLVQAAAIPDNYVTAFFTLFKVLGFPIPETFPATSAPPLADEPILIYGGSTSAAQYMLQLLKLAGYRNIVTTASPRNHEFLKSLGATHTFDYRSADLTSELLSVTNGSKYRYAIDIVAAESSLRALAPVLGTESIIGILLPVKEGDTITNHPEAKMTSEIEPWVVELFPGVDIRPVGTFMYPKAVEIRDIIMPKVLPELLEKGLLQPNKVRLLKSGTLQERVEEGLDLLRNNKISGEKVVVEVKAE